MTKSETGKAATWKEATDNSRPRCAMRREAIALWHKDAGETKAAEGDKAPVGVAAVLQATTDKQAMLIH